MHYWHLEGATCENIYSWYYLSLKFFVEFFSKKLSPNEYDMTQLQVFWFFRDILIQSEMWLKGKIEVLPKTVVFTGRDIFDISAIAWNWPQVVVLVTYMLECECIPSFQCVSSSNLRSNYQISFSHLGSLLNMCMLLGEYMYSPKYVYVYAMVPCCPRTH